MATDKWYFPRIKEQLMREIAWVIANKINDPRIPEIVTITDIKLASDTRNATVSISLYCENKQVALEQLNKAAAYIQKLVAEKVTIKHFPKLYFKNDTSFEKSERINSLLEQVKDDLV